MPWREMCFFAGISAVGAAVCAYLFSFFSRSLAERFQVFDIPLRKARKRHTVPVSLWGGFGIALSLIAILLLLGLEGSLFETRLTVLQWAGFLGGIFILTIGGMLDDRYELPARYSILFPMMAALVVIFTGTGIQHITRPGTADAFYLNWWQLGRFSVPADFLTFVWLLVAIYATKITDGMDGLISGITVIGATMVGLLSGGGSFYQPSSAILAATVAGSYAGFLPHNLPRARQFLGEAGSTLAGFCLGFLAIVSSAKVAIALAVLAIPIADLAFVVFRRIRQRRPWFKGDRLHLHFRLQEAGFSAWQILGFYWILAAGAGFGALFLQTGGKVFLVVMIGIITFLVSGIADRMIRRRSESVE